MNIYILFLAVLFILFVLYIFWRFYYFWRDPERVIPAGRNIVSAADGTVVYVKKIKKGEAPISIKKGRKILLKEITKDSGNFFENSYLIGVFMHPTSVHVNRAPIAGRVESINYIKAKRNFPMTLMWWRVLLRCLPYESCSNHIIENERQIISIKGDFLIQVVQIADIYVNKIVSYVKGGDKIHKGNKIGAILIGSQVDIVFPYSDNIKIKVKKGDKVKAGSSIIAEY